MIKVFKQASTLWTYQKEKVVIYGYDTNYILTKGKGYNESHLRNSIYKKKRTSMLQEVHDDQQHEKLELVTGPPCETVALLQLPQKAYLLITYSEAYH